MENQTIDTSELSFDKGYEDGYGMVCNGHSAHEVVAQAFNDDSDYAEGLISGAKQAERDNDRLDELHMLQSIEQPETDNDIDYDDEYMEMDF